MKILYPGGGASSEREDLPPRKVGEVARSADDQQDVGSACECQDGKRVVKGSFTERASL